MRETSQFDFDEVGETTGKKYKGTFKVKLLLTARDQLKMDERKRSMLGRNSQEADPTLIVWSGMSSELFVRTVDAPDWFLESDFGLEMADYEIVTKIFDKVRELQREYLTEIEEEAKAAKEKLKKKKIGEDE